jgi:hypothetical protein
LPNISLNTFQMKKEFEKQRTNTHVSYIGSRPTQDGNFGNWAKTVGLSPMPIQYELSEV